MILRIKENYMPIFTGSKITFGFQAQAFEVEYDEEIEDLIKMLAAGNSKEYLYEHSTIINSDIDEMIDTLNEFGIIEDVEQYPHYQDIDNERYKTNLQYFSYYSDLEISKYEYQKRLNHSTVFIIGAGGSILTALNLVGMGVKKIMILDFDRIERSNLTRQLVYTENDIGRLKTEAARDALINLDHEVEVEIIDLKVVNSACLDPYIQKADVVINAIDTPPIQGARWVSYACMKHNKPMIQGGVSPNAIVVDHYSREKGCFDCYLLAALRTDPTLIDQLAFIQSNDAKKFDFNTSFAPNISLLTWALCTETGKLLSDYQPPLIKNHTMWINVDTLETRWLNDHTKLAECPSCSGDFHASEPVSMEELIQIAGVQAPVKDDSILEFSLAMQRKDATSFFIGNRQLNEYVEVPEEAAQVIKLFDGQRTVQEVSDAYKEKYNDSVDVLEFVQDLQSMNFIYSMDGEIIGKKDEVHYTSLQKRLGNFFFNKISIILYAILFSASIGMMLTHNHNILNPENSILFPNYFGVSFLIFTAISWGVILFHELGHYLAAIAAQIPVGFKLNLRYLFLVVEADINGVWAIPKTKRHIVYLAGICFDTILLFLALIGRFYIFTNLYPLANAICGVFILVITLSLLQQFMLFIRTDLYYMILTMLNVNGLHMYLKQFINVYILKKEEKSEDIPTKYVAIFLVLSIIGIFFAGISLYYNFAIIRDYLVGGIKEIMMGSFGMILDGTIAIIMSIVNAWLWISGLKNFIQQNKNENQVLEPTN